MSAKLIYAIGDIHGRLDLLDRLLEKIKTHSEGSDYQLVFLGDYIDRGPSSKQVIDRLIELQKQNWKHRPIFLKGNHEWQALQILNRPFNAEFFAKWLSFGGVATIGSYGIEPSEDKAKASTLCDAFRKVVGPAHRKFLKELSVTFQTASHFMCHAGVDFNRPLDKQKNTDLMCIRKAFTESDKKADKVIVHGHTITPGYLPETKKSRIGIDTGAYKSENLTACVLKGRKVSGFVMTLE